LIVGIIAVVLINIALAGLGFYGAWRLWRMRQQVSLTRQMLQLWQYQCEQSLPHTQTQIRQSQGHLQQIQQHYRQWQTYGQAMGQGITLFRWGMRWQHHRRRTFRDRHRVAR
jgi:cytochrome c-type biogenesis protein CcmH/NrfG